MLRAPIFISGLRKSGTSMVKTLLDGHPEVFAFPANEFELFYYTHHPAVLCEKYCRESDPDAIKRRIVENDFITRLNDRERSYGDFRTTVDVEGFRREVLSRDVDGLPELFELLLKAMARHCAYFKGDPETVRYAVKCVLNSEYFPELKAWFPDLKFVYVLRNPYGHFNSVRSSMRKGAKKEGQRLSALQNAYPVLGSEIRKMGLSYYFMRKWRALFPESFYVLVYDRLLRDPAAELQRLAEFLGIAFDDALLAPSVGGELWGGNSWRVESFEGIDMRPLTHWREEISPLEIRLVNEYFRDVLEEFGFEVIPSDAPLWVPLHPSERPVAYLTNRLLFRVKSWFGEYGDTNRDPSLAEKAQD